MAKTGNILIADDETTFLESTADLLRLQGYHCECASDAHIALSLLKQNQFDLLIADIKMPGNHDLALVKELSRQSDSLAVVIATGYPSINTAIDAVNLAVSAYLIKPFACDELFEAVDKVIQKSRESRNSQALLVQQFDELDHCLQRFKSDNTGRTASTLNDFMSNNLLSISKSLIDLNQGLNALAGNKSLSNDACLTMGCRRPQRLIEALDEAVDTLQKTKNSFKSKELADLRKKLESLLAETKAGTLSGER